MTRNRKHRKGIDRSPGNGQTYRRIGKFGNCRKSFSREARCAGLAFASLGCWLNINNEGEHWQVWFPKAGPKIIEWWPSSGKVVVDQHWDNCLYSYRWQDVFQMVRGLVEFVKVMDQV